MSIYPRRQWTSRLGWFSGKATPDNWEDAAPSIPYAGSHLTAFTYPSSTLNLTVGSPLATQTPTVLPAGAVVRYYGLVNQTLPPGLSLNATTGALSGTPTAARAATVYRIYAHAAMSYPFDVTITVT